jgi:hypothetical protein
MTSAKHIVVEDLVALAPALPPPDARWSPCRKAAVVLAARNRVISREEAWRRYAISPEEFAAWETALDRYGIPGLRSTRQQIYRYTGQLRAASSGKDPVQPTRGSSPASHTLPEHPSFGRQAE